MDDILTIEEIRSRYAPNWVLIGEPRTDSQLKLLGGKVLFASRDQDEVHHKARALRPAHYAVRFLGALPENTVLVL
jgi:hypothetical protein